MNVYYTMKCGANTSTYTAELRSPPCWRVATDIVFFMGIYVKL